MCLDDFRFRVALSLFSKVVVQLIVFFFTVQPLNGLASDSDSAWPSIPVPQTAAIPIPICNGCGTSSDAMMLMSSSLSKTVQKYGE